MGLFLFPALPLPSLHALSKIGPALKAHLSYHLLEEWAGHERLGSPPPPQFCPLLGGSGQWLHFCSPSECAQ